MTWGSFPSMWNNNSARVHLTQPWGQTLPTGGSTSSSYIKQFAKGASSSWISMCSHSSKTKFIPQLEYNIRNHSRNITRKIEIHQTIAKQEIFDKLWNHIHYTKSENNVKEKWKIKNLKRLKNQNKPYLLLLNSTCNSPNPKAKQEGNIN